MIEDVYFSQAELLLRILPFIDKEPVFALKGGTAINFFVRDIPRISVDIDLVYLPIRERDASLNEINSALVRISRDIESRIPDAKVIHNQFMVFEKCRWTVPSNSEYTVPRLRKMLNEIEGISGRAISADAWDELG